MKFFTLQITLLLFSFNFSLAQQAKIPAGQGTNNDPYQVSSLDNLYWISQNPEHWDKHYIQIADIDASATASWNGGKGWDPIGDNNDYFCGSYNGQGYSVSGLSINRPDENYNGLFGYIYFSTGDIGIIENLKIDQAQITGNYYTGIICGRSSGLDLKNCQVSGELYGNRYTGGLAGYYWSKYEGVYRCSANVILNSDDGYTGGLFGQVRSADIKECFANVSSDRSVGYGGLAGYMDGNFVSDCYATGFCLNGGLTGASSSAADDNTFQNCYSNLYGGSKVNLSGTHSFDNNSVTNCYYDEYLSFSLDPKTTTPGMKNVASYSGWDIDNTGNATWTIDKKNNGYPYLSWQQDVKTEVSFFAGGDGSEGNPYQVATPWQLHNIYHYPDAFFIQTADISLDTFPFNEGDGWLPIGYDEYIFNGTYNGNGYVIDSLYISISEERQTLYFGLFGYVGPATLKNISLTNINVCKNSGYYTFYAGGLAGHAEGTASNYAEISNCRVSGELNLMNYTGGVLYYGRYLNVEQTSFEGTMTSYRAGGFAYSLSNSQVDECYVNAEINKTSSSSYSAGFVKYVSNTSINNCYATGSLTGSSNYADYAGFIDQFSGNSTNIKNCYSAMSSQIVTGNGFTASSSDDVVEGCLWDTELSGITESGAGIGANTKIMTTKSTFLNYNWDFNSIWGMNGNENSGYPFLQFEGLVSSPDTNLFAGGDGTEGNPYLVATPGQLYDVRGDMEGHYRQIADIDLSCYSNWLPAGNPGNPFRGSYDGGDFTISNLKIEREGDYTGLFSCVDSAFFEGINLSNATITCTGSNCGALAGYAEKTTFSDITLSSDSVSADNNSGIITGSSLNSYYEHCTSSGYVEGNDSYSYTGGLAGASENDTINDCHSSADISGGSYLGGLTGQATGSHITSCSATGDIHTSSGSNLGGLTGRCSGCDISACFASGDITTESSKLSYAGGFSGRLTGGNNIIDCYATGDLNSGSYSSNSYLGGFCGMSSSDTLTNCYSTGYVLGKNTSSTANKGFIGYSSYYGREYNCFFDKETSNQRYDGGSASAKTTAEMQMSATYLRGGWDFMDETANGSDNTWGHNISQNGGYPFLAWQGYANIPRQSRFYVKQSAEGTGDGTSWQNAFTGITEALTALVPGDTLCVAEGNYTPGGGDKNFSLTGGITLLGGFEGTEIDIRQRDPEQHPVILSGGTRSIIYMRNISSCTVDGFTISLGTNTYNNSGGGIYKENGDGSFIIKNCRFEENEGNRGGAVYQYISSGNYGESELIIENCIFDNNSSGSNSSSYGGGAIANYSTNSSYPARMIVRNCLFTNNGSYYGGAVMNYGAGATMEIVNSTFYNNLTKSKGTIYNYYRSSLSVVNSVLYFNRHYSSSGTDIYNGYNAVTNILYCNIEDCGGSTGWNTALGTDGGNNIDSDPFFTDAPGGDFNLTEYSRCVDTGTSDTTGLDLPEVDLNGDPRIFAGTSQRVDMGAYECQHDRNYGSYPPASQVSFSNSTDSTTVISWTPGGGDSCLVFIKADTCGVASPEDGIFYDYSNVYGQGAEINSSRWYAVYHGPDSTVAVTGLDTSVNYRVHVIEHYAGLLNYTNDTTDGNPANTTRLVTNNNNSGEGSLNQAIDEARSGKTIYFSLPAGNEIITLDEELRVNKELTIDGSNIQGSGENITITVTVPGVSSFRVFSIYNDCTFKNMVVKGGSVSEGGAMYIRDNTILENVTITGSNATRYGGGIYIYYSKHCTINNCIIRDNTTPSGSGGGIYNRGYLNILNSSVSNNSARTGGGIYNSSSLYELINTTINGNTATGNGGGIYNGSNIYKSVNNTIYGNTADLGGGIYNSSTIGKLSFNTINRNTATSGGGIYLYNGNMTVQNCIVTGNYTGTGDRDDYYGRYGILTDSGYNILGVQNYYSYSSSPKFSTSVSNGNIYLGGDDNWYRYGNGILNNQEPGMDTVLSDNGGTTLTLAVSDEGFAAAAGITDQDVLYDQRGELRTVPPTIGAYDAGGLPPDATTDPASDITASGITLNGTLNPNGYSTSIIFEYGTTTSYGVIVAASQSPATGFDDIQTSQVITGLDADATYHCRIVAENHAGKVYGEDITFKAAVPEIGLYGNSTGITNESNTPDTSNGTDIGDVLVNTPAIFYFKIMNPGTGALNLTGTPLVAVGGTDSLHFSVTALPEQSISAGDSSLFNITFTPDTIKTFSATVTIDNNVPGEDPFVFAITGAGIDTIPPVFVEALPQDTTQDCSSVTEAVTLTATDNCDTDVEVTFSEVYSDSLCENSYTITRTWIAEDNCGNQAIHSQVVIVEDDIAPTVVTQDVILWLDSVGQATVSVKQIDNGSYDACDIDTMILSSTTYDCINIGDNIVTLKVIDVNNNSDSATATVTVLDTIAPSIKCTPLEVTLRENGEYVLNRWDIEAIAGGTTDNCTSGEEIEISVSTRSFTCVHVGEPVDVNVTVTDAEGNSASSNTTVTVYDKTPPVAICEDVTVVLDENGTANLFPGMVNAGNSIIPSEWARTYNDLTEGSIDACGVESAVLDKQFFDCSDLGENTVTLTISDPNGNAATCKAVVTVIDTIAPVIEPVAGIEIDIEHGVRQTTIDYPKIVVNDNCEVTLTQIEGLGPDGIFPTGITRETWIAADAAGNTGMISFTITVNNRNSVPYILHPVDDQVCYPYNICKLPISRNNGDIFIDPDNDELILEVMMEDGSLLPEWLTFDNDTIVCAPMICDTGCVSIVVMATDPAGAAASDTFIVCVEDIPVHAGDLELTKIEINIYPNPSKGNVFIDFSTEISDIKLSVYDNTGRIVLRNSYKYAQRISFDMSDKISGTYFVKLDVDGKQIVKELVLKR